MQETDVVLRTLVDAALTGRRQWATVMDLAQEARVGDKLAYKALGRPTSIGALTKHPGGGFSVTDPERLLTILAVRRSLNPARSTSLDGAQSLLANLSEYAIGGTRAASRHLGGPNTIADHGPAIVYVPENVEVDGLPDGEGALVMAADERALRSWPDGFTSKAQTYADLFAQPGWLASEFRRALWREWFAVDDWSQGEAISAEVPHR